MKSNGIKLGAAVLAIGLLLPMGEKSAEAKPCTHQYEARLPATGHSIFASGNSCFTECGHHSERSTL
jgi:hypothetical protein